MSSESPRGEGKFWTPQRKRGAAVSGIYAIALTTGMTVAFLAENERIDHARHLGDSAPGSTHTLDAVPQPPMLTQERQIPPQEVPHLPHESVVRSSVRGPLLAAVESQLDSPHMVVTPDEVPGRSVYEFVKNTPDNRRITLIVSANGDSQGLDDRTAGPIYASYEQLGTGEVSSDNPEGNTTIASVEAYSPLVNGEEHYEASGRINNTPFSTQPDNYRTVPRTLTREQALNDLDSAQPASQAVGIIIDALHA